ncbi:unnamed protein product [Timema podura]|uniref:Uncharacterized protein n=1 Tax=Timema podura TaxID=61482 RepID=A0ABN7NS88_TIMPD|nr:unnamed protein product [Timema podura]
MSESSILPVDIDTQKDMDITIKSEPDNYTSCSVKLEHLTDGFLTILENIKVDTNTQEDVGIIIKSEMDDFKPCCVKLEHISDSFITTGKHITKQEEKLNWSRLPGQAKEKGKNIEHEGTKVWKKCKEEGQRRLVKKKDALNGLWGEVNVLNMERQGLGRNVMKKAVINGHSGEVSVEKLEGPAQ